MRQSVAPSRISQAASLAQSNNAAAMSRLQEKKKEFEAVAALERASALFLKRIEGLADDCEVMADAGQGSLLSPCSWSIIDYNLPNSTWSGARAVASYVSDIEHVL